MIRSVRNQVYLPSYIIEYFYLRLMRIPRQAESGFSNPFN